MMNKAGHSQIEIAQLLYRSASTISRELRRNRGLRGYHPSQTQRLSEARHRESHKACKITDEVRE
ncbi:MAG: helix-turn-helix domain-containing protein [Candidatus Thiodiazotropha sp. (ex Lucinoma aequizonata)]|nr:helix-turn-helix domain-containing protein [Candidatus Thiodiazotropha sp. (ex Lucinoma aequizonata)]